MNIAIKATNIDLTVALREYVEKKLESLKKFVGETAYLNIELAKTTNHHRTGDVFKAGCVLTWNGTQYRVAEKTTSLFSAVDMVQDELIRVVASEKSKKESLFRRGAARIKDMLKGFSNPFKK